MNRPRGSAARAIGLMVVAVGFFQTMTVLVKYLGPRYPIAEIVFCRGLFAILPVLPAIWRLGGMRALRVKRVGLLLVRAGCGVASMICVFYALNLLPLADFTALWFVFPLLIAALSAPILHEPVGLARWIAIGAGFAGVLIVAQPTGESPLLPTLMVLLGAVLGTVAMLALRSLSLSEPAPVIVFHYMWVAAAASGLALGFDWRWPSAFDSALLVAVGLSGGLGQLFMTRSYRLAPVSVVAPFEYAAVPVAIYFGWLLWNEIPSAMTYLGGAIIVAAGLFLLYLETRSRTA